MNDTVNLKNLKETDDWEALMLDKELNKHYPQSNSKVSRRKFIEIWFNFHHPDIEFSRARFIQNMFNQKKTLDKKDEEIAENMNILDRVMHKVKQTILTRQEAHKIIMSDMFIREKVKTFQDVIDASHEYIKRHGHYKHHDDNEYNRKHLYGYEHSHRGFSDDLKEQHHDVMSDDSLDLFKHDDENIHI